MTRNREKETAKLIGGLGLAELMLGFAFLLTAAIFLAAFSLRHASGNPGLMVIMAPLLWVTSWITLVKFGAGRIEGGIVPAPATGSRAFPGVFRFVALIIVLVPGILLFRSCGSGCPSWVQMLPLLSTFVLAGSFVLGAARFRLRHLLVLAAFTLLMGTWVSERGSGMEGGLWVIAWDGAGLALCGGIQIRSDRRNSHQ